MSAAAHRVRKKGFATRVLWVSLPAAKPRGFVWGEKKTKTGNAQISVLLGWGTDGNEGFRCLSSVLQCRQTRCRTRLVPSQALCFGIPAAGLGASLCTPTRHHPGAAPRPNSAFALSSFTLRIPMNSPSSDTGVTAQSTAGSKP